MAQHDNMAKDKICEGDHIVDYVIKVTDPSVEKYVLYTTYESLKRTLTFSNKKKTNPKQYNVEKQNPRFFFANCSCPVANGPTAAKRYVV